MPHPLSMLLIILYPFSTMQKVQTHDWYTNTHGYGDLYFLKTGLGIRMLVTISKIRVLCMGPLGAAIFIMTNVLWVLRACDYHLSSPLLSLCHNDVIGCYSQQQNKQVSTIPIYGNLTSSVQ